MLLLALIFYLKYEAPEEEQNFAMVMEMLRAGDVDEENNSTSPLDNLFFDLEKTDPVEEYSGFDNLHVIGANKKFGPVAIAVEDAYLVAYSLQ